MTSSMQRLLQAGLAAAGFGTGLLDGRRRPQTEYGTGQQAHLREHGEALPPWCDRPLGTRSLRLDLYGGRFNLRQMRRGSTLSIHAWGIAMDARTSGPTLDRPQEIYLFGKESL